MKGSPNGFFIILLALYWWHLAVDSDGGHGIDAWVNALDDVEWAIDQMKQCLARSHKRGRDNDGDNDKPEGSLQKYAPSSHILTVLGPYRTTCTD
jgi:hypothetical protein